MLILWIAVLFFSKSLFMSVSSKKAFSFQNEDENAISEGKKLYEDFSLKVLNYGECWQKAVSDLHAGCKMLTEESQSRLALSFANCFLNQAGQETCICPSTKLIADCLKDSSDRVFSTYRSFFTHTKSICFFLEQRAWQQEVENTIIRLSLSSDKFADQLEESLKSQLEMLSLQHDSVDLQQQLIETSERGIQKLNTELDCMLNDTKSIINKFQATSEEQSFMMMSVFEQVKKLETLVLGKFADFYTVTYYFLAILLSYLLTATRRTSSGRIWLMLLFSSNALMERFISSYSMSEESKSNVFLLSDGPILDRIWLCRNFCCISAIVILLVVFIRFKDYEMLNNQLLLEIQSRLKIQSDDLENLRKNLGYGNSFTIATSKELSSYIDMKSVASSLHSESLKISPLPVEEPEPVKEGFGNRIANHFHSTPNSLKTMERFQKPSWKKPPKRNGAPFSPIESLPTESSETTSATNLSKDIVPNRYNLRARSHLSSSRTISSNVSMTVEISEASKELSRMLKRNRN